MNKKIDIWVVLIIIWVGLLFTLVFSWASLSYINGSNRAGILGKIAYRVSKFPATAYNVITILKSGNSNPLLIENRWPNIDHFRKDGIIKKDVLDDTGYLLVSTYDPAKDQPLIKLIRISDQNILHKWTLGSSELDKLYFERLIDDPRDLRELSKKKIFHQLIHPLLLEDGSIIANLDHVRLLKINVNSELVWACDNYTHHSVEMGPNGNLWVPSRIYPTDYDSLLSSKSIMHGGSYYDHAISAVNQDGRVIYKKSVTGILLDNGYRSLLFGTSEIENNPIHLNDIQPAFSTTTYWEKGDLLVSLRNKSTVFLFRPSTNKIIWLKIGPWLHQHDVDFIGNSKVSVFSNNTILNPDHSMLKNNEVYLIDLSNGSIQTPYSNIMESALIKTRSAGLQEILSNGDVFIEENNYARLLRLSTNKIVWEYTETVDSNITAMISWCRYLPKNQVRTNSILLLPENSITQ